MEPNSTFNETTLHISNIPLDTTEQDISYFFKNYSFTNIALISKADKKYSRITFTSADMANKAKEELTGQYFLPWSSKSGQMTCISISKFESRKSPNVEDEKNKNVLVKNLPINMTGREFYLFMSKYGELKTIKFTLDLFWKNKGYAEAYFCSEDSAKKAIDSINKKDEFANLGSKSFMSASLIDPEKVLEENTLGANERRNNLYVKNFPLNYSGEDLQKYFEKYGKIISCIVSKDENDKSKGFGFVCYENPKNAADAFIQENKIKYTFPGMTNPLYVSYAMKKEEREQSLLIENPNTDSNILFARLREDIYILNENQLKEEIQEALNYIMGKEFYVKAIIPKLETRSALVIFTSKKFIDIFISNYTQFTLNFFPKVLFNIYKTNPGKLNDYIGEINSIANPIHLYNSFKGNKYFKHKESKESIYDMEESKEEEIKKTNTKPNEVNIQDKTKDKIWNYKVNKGKTYVQKPNYYDKGYQGNNQGYNGSNNYYNNQKYNYYGNNNYNYYQKGNNKGQYKGKFNRNPQEYKRQDLKELPLEPNKKEEKKVFEKEKGLYEDEKDIYEENDDITLMDKNKLFNNIYYYVEKKNPQKAGKITGMIISLGEENVRFLYKYKDALDNIIEESKNKIEKYEQDKTK
ncbi:MAG: hypothetical protein MJ252_24550 [archaeon]|nr:hypothetical protein [archaeon]